ncbi:MAG: 50S ribosomal protein L23 [Spirochaetes bacterium]|nr:50S ribosomal protein L23 [Spirochaetota bacterium]
MDKNAYSILIEPMLTEKSNKLKEGDGKTKRHYTFHVRNDANKIEVIRAVAKLYNVKPVDCRIVNVKPRRKNRRMSAEGYTRSYKKAIVTLGNNEKIEILK